jgi:Uncharacterised protein family (UPF0158)
MPPTVRLRDIVDALEMQFDELLSFLDVETGEVITMPLDLIREAEEAGDHEEEQKAGEHPEWHMARRIAFMDRVKKLPTKFDVHEWAIMEEFSQAVESERIREDLLNAIHGSGVFRYFKDTVRRYRIEEDWFRFRARALEQIAMDWCEQNGISWE